MALHVLAGKASLWKLHTSLLLCLMSRWPRTQRAHACCQQGDEHPRLSERDSEYLETLNSRHQNRVVRGELY